MIYFTEDDTNIRELVVYTLKSSGFDAKGFTLPSDMFDALEKEKPELILLDIMLPETDGLTVLKKLKYSTDTASIPVILVTAKDSEFDKVIGLDSGADDYITKPFGMMELISRIKAVLRRSEKPENSHEYRIGKLYVSEKKHIVEVDGKQVNLTFKEFSILCMLLKNANIVLSRDQLLNEIWGYAFDGESRTVDVHIRTLRAKLGSCGDIIETIRGMGYKISA